MNSFANGFSELLYTNKLFSFIFLAWSLSWKGLALWRAGRNNQKIWFIPLLIVNLFGLPEIIYLIFFQSQGKFSESIVKFFKKIAKRKGK